MVEIRVKLFMFHLVLKISLSRWNQQASWVIKSFIILHIISSHPGVWEIFYLMLSQQSNYGIGNILFYGLISSHPKIWVRFLFKKCKKSFHDGYLFQAWGYKVPYQNKRMHFLEKYKKLFGIGAGNCTMWPQYLILLY